MRRGGFGIDGAFRAVLLLVSAATVLVPAATHGGPPPPPGGHHRVSYGGDNTAGYPPLITTGLPEPDVGEAPPVFTAIPVPNPFRKSTAIRFYGVEGNVARVRVFTLAGRQVRAIPLAVARSGWQEVPWDGRDDAGRLLPSGAYLYRVESDGRHATGKVIFIR